MQICYIWKIKFVASDGHTYFSTCIDFDYVFSDVASAISSLKSSDIPFEVYKKWVLVKETNEVVYTPSISSFVWAFTIL